MMICVIATVASWMSDCETRILNFYLSIVVTIADSFVSDILACNTQTYRQTMWTIMIAGHNIVTGQLINIVIIVYNIYKEHKLKLQQEINVAAVCMKVCINYCLLGIPRRAVYVFIDECSFIR